jgi:hypothetical protein
MQKIIFDRFQNHNDDDKFELLYLMLNYELKQQNHIINDYLTMYELQLILMLLYKRFDDDKIDDFPMEIIHLLHDQ